MYNRTFKIKKVRKDGYRISSQIQKGIGKPAAEVGEEGV
jgi:hypothetical protein